MNDLLIETLNEVVKFIESQPKTGEGERLIGKINQILRVDLEE